MAKENISEARTTALNEALKQIDKKFGAGSAMRLGEQPKIDVEAFSTGSLALDAATGVGGFPRRRISEIYAQESVGKTTLVLHAIADCQRKGGTAAFVDAEHALDPVYAQKLGVNIDELIISQPESGEQALEIVDMLIRSGGVDFIAIDSVAALTPQAELDGEMSDQQVGLQARMMSKALRKITGAVSQTNTAVVFINQLREKIGGMSYGPSTITSGGKALKFYASLRISMSRTGSKKVGDVAYANTIKAKVDKNKLAPPFKLALFEIAFGEGVSKEGQILSLGEEHKLIKKSGAFYKMKDAEGEEIMLGQGAPKAMEFLKDNVTIRDTLWDQLVEIYSKEYVGYSDPEAEKDKEEESVTA